MEIDREIKEITPVDTFQLGTFDFATGEEEGDRKGSVIMPINKTLNMKTYDLSQVLQREFLVSTFTWSTSDAVGDVLVTLNFPEALFDAASNFIQEKIKGFLMFQGGVQISVVPTANKFMYGKLNAAYTTTGHLNPAFTDPLASGVGSNHPRYYSGYDHVLISATTQQTGKLNVPFVTQNRGVVLHNYAANEICTCRVSVLNLLTAANSTAANSIGVAVFAKFIEPRLFMPCDVTATVAP